MGTKDNDRELLELAAKAGGYELDYAIRPDGKAFYRSDTKALALADGGWFAPLTDDGDALRLAVALGIDIEWRADGRVAAYRHANANGYCFTAFESSREDRAANVRRAIVRAAAEIGRAAGPSRSDDGQPHMTRQRQRYEMTKPEVPRHRVANPIPQDHEPGRAVCGSCRGAMLPLADLTPGQSVACPHCGFVQWMEQRGAEWINHPGRPA